MELISDLKKLDAGIKAFAKRAAAVDKDAQHLGLSAIAAFKEHGNVFYINQLYRALGKGARHTAMTAWLLAYGGVKANTADGKDMTPFVKDKDAVVDLEAATANPWYDFKPSAKPDEVLDYYKLLLAVAKKKPKDGQEVAHGDLLTRIQAILAEVAETEGDTDVDGVLANMPEALV